MKLHVNALIFIFLTIMFFTVSYYVLESSNKRRDKIIGLEALTQKNIQVKKYAVEERKNIFFLKAHKCASSTLQNILMRFGFANNLDFVLPANGNYLGNPEYFSDKFIPVSLRSLTGKYNIFTHHTRYNFTSVKNVMYPDAAFVTILRDPADLYESLFSFYHLEKNKLPFKKIINDPSKHKLLKTRLLGKIGLNQMSWDLGNKDFDVSKAKIKKFLRKIEKEFDLVLISEHIEASLVLLCDLMKWPLKHVTFLKLNSRPASRKQIMNETERDILSNLNAVDTELYDFFLDKFRQKIQNYGVDRMMQQVKELLKLNSELWKNCVDKSNNKGYAKTLNYDIRNNLDWTCYYSTKDELMFTDEIREDQIRRFSAIKKLENFIEGSI